MRGTISIILISFWSIVAIGQGYETRTAHLYIQSTSSYMDVDANNYQVYSDVNFKNKSVNFVGLMKSWEFELGALDRAFNSDRLNLSGYPKFNFEGRILPRETGPVRWNKPGKYDIYVKGNLFIGGYKRMMTATGVCYVKEDGSIDVESDFSFQIEEESMEVINDLMKERLPQVVSMDTNTLGISRDINVKLYASYNPK